MPCIRRVTSAMDWRQASALLYDYVAWIRAAVRIDPLVEQPSFAVELASLARHYSEGNARLFIAYDDELAVGTVAVQFHQGGSAELKRLYVRPVARGLGVSDALVAYAVDAVAAHGCHCVWLESLRGVMDAAIAVYRRNGFVQLDEPGRTIAVDGVVVMERRIAPAARVHDNRWRRRRPPERPGTAYDLTGADNDDDIHLPARRA